MSFNEKLQHLRKTNKLSQEQLADMLDVTRQSVSKWESGTTYPEMDKLITMCKIFKCSLDDLTNDEVTNIDVEKKNSKDNFIGNMASSIVDIVDRTIKMFRSMNARKIIGTLISLFLIGCFLLLLRIPFEYLEKGFRDIMINIPSKSVSGLGIGLFNLVFDIAFFILYILAFVYIYKTAYLDKYAVEKIEKETDEKKEVSDKLDESISKKEKKEIKIVRESKKNENTLFCFLGNIVIWFFRIMLGICLLPFIFTLVMLFAALVIKIKLMFDGVTFIGVLLGIIFAIILNLWLLEIGCAFIFNKHSSFKRLLWTFLIGLAGVGISIGLTAMEISTMNYVEETPQGFVKKTLPVEFSMSDDLTIDEAVYYYSELKYIEDESLIDKVKIEIDYCQTLNTPVINKGGGVVTINVYYEDSFGRNKKMWELLKDDLARKQIRDYGKLHNVVIKITSSSKNIAKIKENSDKYFEEQYKEDQYSYIYEYEITIRNYERQVDSLLEENEDLKAKIEELEEYKERVKDVLE